MDSVLGSVGNLRARQCTLTCDDALMAVSLAVHHHIIDHSYYIIVKMFVVWGVFVSFVSFVLFLFSVCVNFSLKLKVFFCAKDFVSFEKRLCF